MPPADRRILVRTPRERLDHLLIGLELRDLRQLDADKAVASHRELEIGVCRPHREHRAIAERRLRPPHDGIRHGRANAGVDSRSLAPISATAEGRARLDGIAQRLLALDRDRNQRALGYIYSCDYQQRSGFGALPIAASAGLRGELSSGSASRTLCANHPAPTTNSARLVANTAHGAATQARAGHMGCNLRSAGEARCC